MELVLALVLGLGTYEYINKEKIDLNKHQVVDPNPAVREILQTSKGQYFANNVQQESEVQWIILTN